MGAGRGFCAYNPAVKRERNLTISQVITVSTIRNFIHAHGHAPTLRELAALLDRSRGSTMDRVRALARRGLIRKIDRRHRTIEIVPPPPRRKAEPPPAEDDDLITW